MMLAPSAQQLAAVECTFLCALIPLDAFSPLTFISVKVDMMWSFADFMW